MSRTPDITTKAVAARIPMADYLRILKEATDAGMSLSDWLLLKIYNEESKVIEDLKSELKEEKTIHKKTELDLSDASGEVVNLKKEVSELKKHNEQVTKSAAKFEAEATNLSKQMKSSVEENKALQSKITALQKTEAHSVEIMQKAAALNKELKASEEKWKNKYSGVIEKNKFLQTTLKTFHEKEWSIPRVLKIVDEHLQTA